MSTEKLLKGFQEILAAEEKAKNFYCHYINQVEDNAVKKQIIVIRDDEIIHIEIAKKTY